MIKLDFQIPDLSTVTWSATCNSERSAQVTHGPVWHDTGEAGTMRGGRHEGKVCVLLCPLDDNNNPMRQLARWVPQAMIDWNI